MHGGDVAVAVTVDFKVAQRVAEADLGGGGCGEVIAVEDGDKGWTTEEMSASTPGDVLAGVAEGHVRFELVMRLDVGVGDYAGDSGVAYQLLGSRTSALRPCVGEVPCRSWRGNWGRCARWCHIFYGVRQRCDEP